MALSLAYFVHFTLRNADALPSICWDTATGVGLGSALGVYLLVILLSGLSWWVLLRSVGEAAALGTTLGIFAVAQFGKYVPGNVAHLAGRVVLAVHAGFNQERVLATMALEIAWAVLSGIFVAGSALTLGGAVGLASGLGAPPAWLLASLVAAALTVPALGAFLLRHLPTSLRERIPGLHQVHVPRPWPLLACFLLGCSSMLLLGGIPVLLKATLFGGSRQPYLAVAGIFALAWTAGFITPGAPAGLGVRDAILVTGLTPMFGAGAALGVTVVMRLVTSVGDALAFMAGLAGRSRARPSATGTRLA